MENRKLAIFYLNGMRQEIAASQGGMMLADFLRRERGLTGTKIVCAEGDCGACTVLRYYPLANRKYFQPVNSCITTVAQMDGSSLVTVDVLSQGGIETLTEPQKAMQICHGSQCGYCTPGFVMALTGLVEKKLQEKSRAPIEEKEAKNYLTGNLCRCTGYQPIIEAAASISLKNCESVEKRFFSQAQKAELKKIISRPLYLEGEEFSFYAPKTLKEAAKYLQTFKEAKIIGASTDLGVVHNKYKSRLRRLVSLHLIEDLYKISYAKNTFTVGARVTLAELRSAVEKKIPELASFLDLFASPQIKNAATLVGNVGNASPIADLPPFLLAVDSSQLIIGPKGSRRQKMDGFYKGYRKTALKNGEVIASISFPVPQNTALLRLYKSSQRKDLDISAVNAAFFVEYSGKDKKTVKTARVALGGVAAIPLRLKKLEKILEKKWSPEMAQIALAQLQKEITPLSDLRGSAAFRRILAENLLKDFLREMENHKS